MPDHRPQTDEFLIDRIQSGCELCFNTLYERYFVQICEISYRYVKRRDIAQDVAQDTLITALNNIDKLKDVRCFKAWIRRVTINRSLDVVRKRTSERTGQITEDPEDRSPVEMEDLYFREERFQKVEETIASLRSEDSQLLLMKYRDQYSIADLSRIWQASESSIKMRLKRIRDKIKMQVQD